MHDKEFDQCFKRTKSLDSQFPVSVHYMNGYEEYCERMAQAERGKHTISAQLQQRVKLTMDKFEDVATEKQGLIRYAQEQKDFTKKLCNHEPPSLYNRECACNKSYRRRTLSPLKSSQSARARRYTQKQIISISQKMFENKRASKDKKEKEAEKSDEEDNQTAK